MFKLQEAGVDGMILKVFQNSVVLKESRLMVSVLLYSVDVVSGVSLVLCCFYFTLLIFQGYLRMCWLVMLTTLPLFCRIPHPRE